MEPRRPTKRLLTRKNTDACWADSGVFSGCDEFLVVRLVTCLVGNPAVGYGALLVKHIYCAVGDSVETEIRNLHLQPVVGDCVAAHVADESKGEVVFVAEGAQRERRVGTDTEDGRAGVLKLVEMAFQRHHLV